MMFVDSGRSERPTLANWSNTGTIRESILEQLLAFYRNSSK